MTARRDLSELAQASLLQLDAWLAKNGWSGYDPYDVRGLPFVVNPAGSTNGLARWLILAVEGWFPRAARRLARIRPSVNAKAMGLFAEGYRQLYTVTGDERHLQRALEALDWLETHRSQGYSGACWGYPFDWRSRILIPRGTPSSVVSATVGHAFWGFYRMTAEPRHLEVCHDICEFFVRHLRIDRLDGERICFSYTPLDTFHVHNANLFVAEFLVRTGLEVGREDYVGLGMQAAAYALSEQNDDGSICYWGHDQSQDCRVDHYHSGFEIRSLYGIWQATGDATVRAALDAYYAFYKDRLFESSGIPKMTPHSLYPINIHSCAEAILCHSTLAPDFPEAWDYLARCVTWTLEEMQHRQGWFIYMIRSLGGTVPWRIEIPYIRWGQAWMLRALAACLAAAGSDGP
jgi:rhamnogalacturonyl hydrolase YesR